jgi:NADP-dependent 3-hydroxy acid dehydrogenase YdfG
MTALPLLDRRILLTGASAGIGQATAQALVQAGATVFATGRRMQRLEALRDSVGDAPGRIEIIAGDLADPAFIAALAEWAATPDILINNAGQLRHAPFLESDPADWLTVFDSNVLAVLRLTQLVARKMVAAGSGHIINVTSTLAGEVTPYTLAYAASKHALRAVCRGLRVELRQYGIKVTEVAPGLVTTEINRAIPHEAVRSYYRERSTGIAYLEPSDIAAAILYAASTSPNALPELLDVRPVRQGG